MNLLRHTYFKWRDRRLWVRLALGFGTLVTLMIVVAILAAMQFRSMANTSAQAMGKDLQRILKIQEIRHHAQGHGSAMALLLTSPRSAREKIYPAIDAEYTAIDRLLTDLMVDDSDSASAQRLAHVAALRSKYRDVFIEVVTLIEGGDQAQASSMFYQFGQPALQSLIDTADAMVATEQSEVLANQRAIIDQGRRTESQLAGMVGLAILLAIWLSWRTTRRVAKPLKMVESAAQMIADGNYAARVHVRGNDELGKLAKAMNAMAVAVSSREADIERLAYIDRLTGLPNRAMLDRLGRGIAPNKLSIIMMDVARLRMVNEVLGFDAGDSLLIQIADGVRQALAPQLEQGRDQILARLDGGVFAVLCVEMDRALVEQLRARIEKIVSVPMSCNGNAVDVQLVCGLSDAEDDPSVGITGLLLRAETAIGECKRTKRSWAWHDPESDELRARHLSLLSSLRQASETGELEMWLQPKQCLRTGRTLGMEGLVRWRHPLHGLISPSEFIPFAERTGHIGVITHAMVEAALTGR